MSRTAVLFPGQGAQSVGMGKDVHDASPAARKVFDVAEQATDLPLRKLCFEGPADELSRTDHAQPCILTVSAAMLAAMDEALGDGGLESLQPEIAAGLSLGEYTALYAADAIDLAEVVRLVSRRGELMQQAATATPSGMCSVIGLDEQAAEALVAEAAQGQPLVCANFNCPGQIVLSGAADAIDRAADLAEKHGARGAVKLDVAGAFHSDVMAPAAEAFQADLGAANFRAPKLTVLSNVDAQPHGQPDEIRAKLLAQLTRPVRWQQSMEHLLAKGYERFFEIGPGKVLAGLMRRIQRKTDFTCINSAESVQKLAHCK